MAEKKTAGRKPIAAKPDTPKERLAKSHELMLMASAQNASAMEKFAVFGDLDVSALVESLHEKQKRVQEGDMRPVEAMLYGQAQALQAIFTNMARRSGMNAGQYMDASDKYMRLALKAQGQCRATLETLAMMKNPQPYIRQANIAQGHQQVNNMYATPSAHTPIHSAPENRAETKPIQTLENNPSPAISEQYAHGRAGAEKSQKMPNKLLRGNR